MADQLNSQSLQAASQGRPYGASGSNMGNSSGMSSGSNMNNGANQGGGNNGSNK